MVHELCVIRETLFCAVSLSTVDSLFMLNRYFMGVGHIQGFQVSDAYSSHRQPPQPMRTLNHNRSNTDAPMHMRNGMMGKGRKKY